jgi:hypothetical protein
MSTTAEILERFKATQARKHHSVELASLEALARAAGNAYMKVKDGAAKAAVSDLQRVLNERVPALRREAVPDEDELAQLFADLLAASDFSHVTGGHPVSPNCFHVYHRADTPTNCLHAYSFKKSARNREVLRASGRTASAGGTRGEAATRASLGAS